MMPFWEAMFWGNPMSAWALAVGVGVALTVGLLIIKRLSGRMLQRIAERTRSRLGDLVVVLIRRTHPLLLLIFAAYGAATVLTLSPRAERALGAAVVLALLAQVAIWGTALITLLVSWYVQKQAGEDPIGATTAAAFGFFGRLVLWTVVLLLALDNLGIDVTTLIAGLGVGGIAVALALQNILGDLFASFSIVFDKPFVIGDFIIVDDLLGTVEHIGLKTTRVRSLSGEQIIFANSDLLKSRIRNYKRMYERRVVFTLGVTYETPYEKLVMVPAVAREAITIQPQTRFDRAHFKAYGDFALQFETVYYVTTPDYNVYMDTQQAINLAIYQRFQELGIDFAYPTQTLNVRLSPGTVPALSPGRPAPAS